MSSQLTVIIAGIVLVVAIVVALVIMRRGDSRFTYDTQHGTAPRATEGEGNTAATAFKGRFSILTAGVGAMFAALAVKLWGMQMVSSDYYEKQANSNQTRTVTTPAVRGRILDRNGVALVQNRPSLAVVAYRDLAEDEVLVRHLANVLGMPYVAVLRNIQDNTEGAQSLHTIATDVRRSTVAYIKEHAGEFPGVKIAERTERQYPYGETHAISWAIPAPSPPSSSRLRIRKPLAMMMLLLARLRTSRAISWARRALRATTKICCRVFVASRPSRSMPQAM